MNETPPPAGIPETMGTQETTSESTPDQRCWNTGPGPRRPSGDDRLMDTVPRPPDLPHAICPTCGSTPSARSLRRNGSVRVEDYSDAAGHIWTTKWLEVA